jgi:transcriptional regulator with XRE-family HTH domain
MIDIEKIKALREKLGLSQAEAAEKAGMNGRQDWSAIETGRRPGITVATLEKIASALGVRAKDLLK